MDEASLRSDPGRRRVLNTPVITYTDRGKKYAVRSMSLFGFMSLNGSDVVMASQSAKTFDVVSFLDVVRGQNGSIKETPILIVLDNATIHKARLTRTRAGELGIFLVPLPPYSPDLNPIEFPWKDMKRELAAKLNFDAMVDASGPTTLRLFSERRLSYTSYWTEKFICDGS